MKRFKNIIKVVGAVSLSAVMAFALYGGSITYTLAPLGYTNTLAGPLTTGIIIISASASNTSVLAYDAPALTTTYSNIAYTTTTQYTTNYVTSYVNFFGATNTYTNVALVLATNTVAARTNSYPIRFTAATAAGTMSTIDDAAFFFMNGLLITNTSPTGAAVITVQYAK